MLYDTLTPNHFGLSSQVYGTNIPAMEQPSSGGPLAGSTAPETTSSSLIPVATETFRGSAEPRDTRWPPATPSIAETPLVVSNSGPTDPQPAEPATPPEQPEAIEKTAPPDDLLEKTPAGTASDAGTAVTDPASGMPEQQQGADAQPDAIAQVQDNDSASLPPSDATLGNESAKADPLETSLHGDDTTLPPLQPALVAETKPEPKPEPKAEPAAQLPEEPRKTGQDPPVIRYSRGKPVPGGNTVRGKAGNSANVVDTSVLYGSAASRSGQQAGRRAGRAVLPVGQDSVVPFAFVADMAQLLVQGYWPEGTHPRAVSGSISTVTVKGLNTRYGVSLQGLNTDSGRRNYARTRILEYVLRPSMVEGLYGLYAERFILAMRDEAGRERFLEGGQRVTLSIMHKISLFTLYADMLKGVSAGIRSYLASPDIASSINEYIVLEQKTQDAARRYAEAKNRQLSGAHIPHSTEKQYHAMVAKREQAKMKVASAMRASHSKWELDADSLVYLATWLHRRPPSMHEGMQSLANCFDKLSLRMREEASILQGGE